MAENVFRRTLRIPVPVTVDSVDALLIAHMEELEKDSPHRLQEWVRNCLRSAYMQEKAVVDCERRSRGGEG
ncbi:MAG: hypothetical protein ITG07_02700 [Candidimonas sp.]|nr:hypothetical protein [Candidimonas sp.]